MSNVDKDDALSILFIVSLCEVEKFLSKQDLQKHLAYKNTYALNIGIGNCLISSRG